VFDAAREVLLEGPQVRVLGFTFPENSNAHGLRTVTSDEREDRAIR
jgi:hypothetical protein